jgi:hypothetical protein
MVKVKSTLVQALRLCTGRTAQRGSRGIALLFLDHGTGRGWGVSLLLGRSLPREKLGTHFTGGWVGPRSGLDRCGKCRPPPGFDRRTVQPVGSRYTDWATRPTLGCKLTINQVSINIMYYFRDSWINIGREKKCGRPSYVCYLCEIWLNFYWQ